MSDFGIQFLRPNGSVSIDSTNKAGVYVETLSLQGDQSGSKIYTDIPAGYLYFIIASADQPHSIVVDNDSLGHARITWTASTLGTMYQTTSVVIFARRTNSSDSATILNADGDYLADLSYATLQYSRTIAPYAQNRNNSLYVSGGGAFIEATYQAGSNTLGELFFLNVPDSTDDNVWYAFNPYSGAYKELKVYIYTPNGTGKIVKLPSVHAYSLGTPVSAGSPFGMQCLKANSALTFDSSAENIAIKDTATITPQGKNYFPTPDNYTVAMPATCGIIAPFYKEKWFSNYDNQDGSIVEYWMAMFQRKGSTFSYQMLLVSGTPGQGQYQAQYAIGEGANGGGAIFIDISQVNPSPSYISIFS